MAEFSELEIEDQAVINAAIDAAFMSLRNNGVNTDGVNYADLLDAMVGIFEQATR